MADLVACLSSGKGTWLQVSGLIKRQEWGNIFLITNEFGKEKFTADKKVEMIVVNTDQPLIGLVDEIKNALDGRLSGDVAVNLISGSGKEHMAIISALLKLGVGIRLIALTKEGIKEI